MRRLRSRPQFQAALAGATVARTAHFALHRCALDVDAGAVAAGALPLFPSMQAWIGVLVPKRWARRAVTRNAIRRQIYQVAQESAPGLPAAAHVVRLRTGFDKARFPSASSDALKRAVRLELGQLFARASQPQTARAGRTVRAADAADAAPSAAGASARAAALPASQSPDPTPPSPGCSVF